MADGAVTSHPKVILCERSKEELADEILRLREVVEQLRKENEKLKEKVGEKAKPESKVHMVGAMRRKRRRRWRPLGRPKGHVGCTRRKPDHVDHTVHQRLSECPDCGGQDLSELSTEAEEHIQEDIVPAHVEVTQFVRHVYWCPCCGKKKNAPYAPEEVPYGYLGPNVLIHTILLKYHHGLPYAKIQMIFRELCQLRVTDSALAQALQRLGRWLQVEDKVILEAVRASPYLHMDETGWKIAGDLHWIWNAVNQRLALYRIRESRGRKVPREILTENYGGVIISDFLSAYNRVGRRRQRCLIHLLRELKACRESDDSESYRVAYRVLKRILRDAKRLDQARGELAPWVFVRRVRRLKERLFDFVHQPFANAHWKRLAKRLKRCHEELLTFLDVPGLPQDNNHAERMIRPNVLFRKISFQNMSRKGADAHEVLMSLLQTLRLRERNPVSFLKTAYLRHRQGNPAPLLSL